MRNYPSRSRLWTSSQFGVIEFQGPKMGFCWDVGRIPDPKSVHPKSRIVRFPAEVEIALETYLQVMAKNGFLIRTITIHNPDDADEIFSAIDEMNKLAKKK